VPKQSLRALLARPWLTLVIVTTLALGIGANAAVFSVVDALLLRPLPYPDADRLVRIGSLLGGEDGAVTWPELRDVGSLHDVFADVAAYTDQGQYNASGDGPPEELAATSCTHNLFQVLGSRRLSVGRGPRATTERVTSRSSSATACGPGASVAIPTCAAGR
jgi:hypothetical protein